MPGFSVENGAINNTTMKSMKPGLIVAELHAHCDDGKVGQEKLRIFNSIKQLDKNFLINEWGFEQKRVKSRDILNSRCGNERSQILRIEWGNHLWSRMSNDKS